MNAKNLEEKIAEAARLLATAEYPICFTGAGISAESGVPTFRGPEGLWEKHDPQEAVSLSSFRNQPEAFWDFARDLVITSGASPNPGHRALVRLEDQQILKTVITQNIDMLHQQAGSKNVLELHGSLEKADCRDCGAKYSWQELENILKAGETPQCRNCGSLRIKPRIVFFGERLPEEVLERSWQEAQQADLMLVIGSSLVVYPAAGIPDLTLQAGGKLIYVNADRGSRAELFDIILTGRAGSILPRLAEKTLKIIEKD